MNVTAEVRNEILRSEQSQTLDHARALLHRFRRMNASSLPIDSFESLETMIDMAMDEDWELPEDIYREIFDAVTGFRNLVRLQKQQPSQVAYLMHELRYEIRAYEDFCEFRDKKRQRNLNNNPASISVMRIEWLDAKRAEHRRIRRGRFQKFRAFFK